MSWREAAELAELRERELADRELDEIAFILSGIAVALIAIWLMVPV